MPNMPKRGYNMNNISSGHYGGAKKPNNMNNRNSRPFGGKSNSYGGGGSNFGGSGNNYGSGMNSFGSNLSHQVSPWLSQSSGPALGGFGRSVASDQQAQLALASTLLNNLLKPASQLTHKAPATPPSLLSLSRSTPNSSSSYGAPSSSFGRDRFNFGRPNAGKVQKEYRKGDFKNKRFGDRKNKKPNQPNRQANVGKKTAEKKDVIEEIQVETMDVDQSASEKNETVTTTTDTPTADPDSTASSKSATEPKKDADAKKTKKDEPKASYAGIPSALLFCHICRKHMWDDSSFEKHLEGKPHKMMVHELDVSYSLKVDLLRHEMRVSEQQRENDIQRAQRKGKGNLKSQQRDFCAMCNLSFLGMLPAHRKNERHQRLKKFLHPKCNICSKEFYTRLEWDDHKLTPTHLKKLAEIRKETRPDLEDSEFDIIDFIEDIDDEFDMENIELKVVGKSESAGEEKGEAATNGGDENEKEETNEEKAEDEEFKKLPKYTPGMPVGENFVVEKTGSLCRACNKFCLTSEDAKTHCQSVAHYNNVIKIMKAQNKIVRKRRLNDSKTEDDSVKTVQGEEDKKSETENEPSVAVEVNGVVKEEPQAEEKSGDDVYDPENPGSENEKDVEMENAVAEKPNITDKEEEEAGSAKTTAEEASPADQPKQSVPDAKNQEVEVKLEPLVEESPTKRTRGQTAAVSVRGPRARRGRRH